MFKNISFVIWLPLFYSFFMTIDKLYTIFCEYPLICTDSRQVSAKSLFFALKGGNFDGNLYAGRALENGAAFAIVDNPSVALNSRYLLVDDALAMLQQLAAFHRKKLGLPVIAVTGTNGKTTTKELIAAVLGTQRRIEYTRGNLNNHIGVPLTLLAMNEKTEIGIVEMGANHPGEIGFLCQIADPDYGIVTNMGKAHLEGFLDFEGVVRTKSELYRYLEDKNGVIFINDDNPILKSAAGVKIRQITYGSGNNCKLKGESVDNNTYLSLTIHFPEGPAEVKTRLIGNYNFENVMAAVTIGSYFGIDTDRIIHAVESYSPSNNRSQLITTENNTIVMDAYNANPSSMQASISNFLGMNAPRKLLILGDMLELGKESPSEHQKIVDMLIPCAECSVILVGSHFAQTRKPENFLSFSGSEELAVYLSSHSVNGTLILVKGSHGIRLERILDAIN